MEVQKAKTAGGVVVNREGKVLVVNQNHNSWSLPKGQIELEEDALSAAKREIFEESGVRDLTLIKPLPIYSRFRIGPNPAGEDRSVFVEMKMFLFKTDFEGELKPIDPENPEARWVAKEEVADLLTHPKDKEFFRKVMFEI